MAYLPLVLVQDPATVCRLKATTSSTRAEPSSAARRQANQRFSHEPSPSRMSLRASYALIFLWPMLSKVEGFQQNRPQGALLWQAQRPTRALLLRDQTTLSYHRPGHIRRCSGGYTRFYSSASPDDPAQEEGEFRIQPKDAVDAFLGVADDVDPAFQGRRRSPAPLSDNVTVLVGTVGLLAAVIGAFLFSNRDIPPFPVTH